MDKDFVGTVLAALLHDIGKFAQKFEGNKYKGMKHEKIGKTIINKILSQNKTLLDNYNILHRYFVDGPEYSDSNKIVKLADWIASSERHDEEKENEKKSERPRALINILSEVKLDKKDKSDKQDKSKDYKFSKESVLKLDLSLIDDVAQSIEETNDISVFEEFEKELKNILISSANDTKNISDIEVIRKLSDLLKKYTSFSTSAWYYSKSDISLYAHSKMTAAMASCLYYLNKEKIINLSNLQEELEKIFNIIKEISSIGKDSNNEDERFKKQKEEFIRKVLEAFDEKSFVRKPLFLLVKGNFSGIQNFISQIYSKNALKMLKARSTYLSLLNELIPLELARELGLTELNVIFSGGGNFELIVPNLDGIKDKINEFKDKINNELWKRYKGDIYLEISFRDLNVILLNRYCYKHIFYNDDETIGENYSKLFLLEGSDEFRRKKFKEQIKREIQENDSIIDDGFSGIEKEICSVCHKIEDKRKGQYNDDAFFCSDCNGLLKLNLVFKKIDEKFKIGLLDKDHLFNFEDINLLSYWKELDSININKIEPPFEIIPLGYPLKDSDSEIVPFSELAERSSGGKRLAALKLDVDNLGNIFTKGIKEMTFSKYYQLSMMLDFFFKGIVQELRNQDEYKDYIYIIFSGGDDAFFIGSWDKVLMFAFDLYKLFKNYSGNNPYVNISASYFMFDESYPVFKVYKDSEELLEKAKENGKNKINVNGLLLNWSQVSELKNKLFSNEYNFNVSDNEVELFVNLVNLFYSLVEQAIIGRSLLSNWYYLTKESIELSEVNVPKVWMFKYSITRNVKNKDLQEDLWNLFKEYFSKVMSENLNKKILLYALKIVLFYTREVKK